MITVILKNQRHSGEGYMKRQLSIAAGLVLIGMSALWHPASGQSGWTDLFNGNSLDNWDRVGEANWTVTDGAIQADKKVGEPSAFLVTKQPYKDFEFRAEFFVDAGTNSGVFIRCSDPKKITAVLCYEVNIWDTRPDPSYGTGAIVNVAKVDPMPKAGGKWNVYEISAKGGHLVIVLNGAKTVDAQDSKLPSGFIALQYSGEGVLKFRKVQVKSL
jgi:hypothetical protein